MNKSNPIRRHRQVFTRSTCYFTLALLLVAAFIARSLVPIDYVFGDLTQPRLLGVDPFYHLRIAHQILQDFPHIQRWDMGSHFPSGESNKVAGLFNIIIALLTLLIYGAQASLAQTAAVAAWLPPIFGLMSCVCLFLLTRNLMGNLAGLTAVALFILYPGDTLDRTMLGFADQHCLEIFLSLASVLGLLRVFTLNQLGLASPWWQPALLAALPFVLLVYSWKGAALILPLIAISLLLYWTLLLAKGERSLPLITNLMRYVLAVLLLLLTVNFLMPDWIVYPKGMRWLLFGTIALTFAAILYLTAIAYLSKRYPPAMVAFSAFLLCLSGCWLLLTSTNTGHEIYNALFQARNALVREQQNVNLTVILQQLGSVAILAVIGIIGGIYMAWRRWLAPQVVIVLSFAALWWVLWWQTNDFDYHVPPFLAFAAVIPLWALVKKLTNKNSTGKKGAAVNLLYAAGLLIAALLIIPFQLSETPWIDHNKLSSAITYQDQWFEAAKWLQQNTPPDAEHGDTGVIVSWDFGNILAAYSGLPVVWSRYPSSQVAHWSLASNEDEAMRWLCPSCQYKQRVRYAVVDADTFGPFFYAKSQQINLPIGTEQVGHFNVNGTMVPHMRFDKRYRNAMIHRLYADDGAELSHYRLVYETTQQHYHAAFLQLSAANGNSADQSFNLSLHNFPINNNQDLQRYQQWVNADVVTTDDGFLYDGQIQPSIKIYQVVKGSVISGRTKAAATVQVRLSLTNKTNGRKISYTRTSVADDKGHYQLTVPYRTGKEVSGSNILASMPYQLYIKAVGEKEYVWQQAIKVAP
jgi:asparagine N-glycosylation enzyme membrane subunit Stt3